MASKFVLRSAALGASLLSATAFWFGTGLQPLWFLTWLAALPVLLIAPKLSFGTALACSFAAYAAGTFNTWTYLGLLPLPFHLLFIAIPSAVFACCVSVYRALVVRGAVWPGLFAVPALWTSYVYLMYLISPHGTFGALAYSQANCLPVLQLAALGGIWPIEFLIFLIPSAAAMLAIAPARWSTRIGSAACAGVVGLAAISYGLVRLSAPIESHPVSIGLIASDEPENLRAQDSLPILHRYLAHATALAQKGAKIIVLPEHLVSMRDSGTIANGPAIDALLSTAASAHGVGFVVGVDHAVSDSLAWNEARYYPPDNTPVVTYAKHHLLPGLEGAFCPGDSLSTFTAAGLRFGLAICKDMDFPSLSVAYSRFDLDCLIVPAFDFSADAWLHSRMAIVRSVESGFPLVRTAKKGALTVSDNRGRVRAELRTRSAPFVALTTPIPLGRERTVYSGAGDWFAWLALALSGFLVATLFRGWKDPSKKR
jgi:apolipoprotein N-acyltransferase